MRRRYFESILNSMYMGSRLEKFSISKFDFANLCLSIDTKFTIPNFCYLEKNELRFKPLAPKLSDIQSYIRHRTRKFPLRVQFPSGLTSIIKIAPPEGLEFDIPKSVNLYTRFGYYSLS